MKKLILENFRCFRSFQEARLAPLTLLVGENSTGKSSFLAATRIAWMLAKPMLRPDFNQDPFQLGAFEQIANYRGGRGGRAGHFAIGAELSKEGPTGNSVRVLTTFRKGGAQPEVAEYMIESSPYCIAVFFEDDSSRMIVNVETPGGKLTFPMQLGDYSEDQRPELWSYVRDRAHGGIEVKFDALKGNSAVTDNDRQAIASLMLGPRGRGRESIPMALAPIRSQPLRTYDPVTDVPKPSGGHVPMILAMVSASQKDRWKSLRKSLEQFGQAGGLFDSIDVKRLGTTDADPFQIRLKVSGPPTNLIDVGYGVSQVLPILVDSIRGDEDRMFLLQQPEVHLHPRAQAELGTFFANLVKSAGKKFVVETHSDYLIDRVRMDVRDGKTLKPEDVVILFFEREGTEVKIHEISIDPNGNVVGAPPGYRQFFMDEERRFFGG